MTNVQDLINFSRPTNSQLNLDLYNRTGAVTGCPGAISNVAGAAGYPGNSLYLTGGKKKSTRKYKRMRKKLGRKVYRGGGYSFGQQHNMPPGNGGGPTGQVANFIATSNKPVTNDSNMGASKTYTPEEMTMSARDSGYIRGGGRRRSKRRRSKRRRSKRRRRRGGRTNTRKINKRRRRKTIKGGDFGEEMTKLADQAKSLADKAKEQVGTVTDKAKEQVDTIADKTKADADKVEGDVKKDVDKDMEDVEKDMGDATPTPTPDATPDSKKEKVGLFSQLHTMGIDATAKMQKTYDTHKKKTKKKAAEKGYVCNLAIRNHDGSIEFKKMTAAALAKAKVEGKTYSLVPAGETPIDSCTPIRDIASCNQPLNQCLYFDNLKFKSKAEPDGNRKAQCRLRPLGTSDTDPRTKGTEVLSVPLFKPASSSLTSTPPSLTSTPPSLTSTPPSSIPPLTPSLSSGLKTPSEIPPLRSMSSEPLILPPPPLPPLTMGLPPPSLSGPSPSLSVPPPFLPPPPPGPLPPSLSGPPPFLPPSGPGLPPLSPPSSTSSLPPPPPPPAPPSSTSPSLLSSLPSKGGRRKTKGRRTKRRKTKRRNKKRRTHKRSKKRRKRTRRNTYYDFDKLKRVLTNVAYQPM